MYGFWDDVMVPILAIGGALLACFVVIASIIVTWDYLDCRGFQNGTGMETRWWWGCYAKVEGEWIPKDYAFGKVNEIRLKDKREKR